MKKSRKKIMAVLLAAVTAASALAGCSSGSSGTETSGAASSAAESAETEAATAAETEAASAAETTAAAEESGDGEQVTLRFAWWGTDTRHEALLKAIDLYEQQHSNIKVEGEYQGYDGYYEKMITTVSSGTAPDIMQATVDWLMDFQGENHYLADLSKLPIDMSVLSPLVVEGGSYNGEPLLYSATVVGQVMYVNKAFADAYHFDTTKTYTWDSLIAEGQRIHEEDPEAYLMTADIDVLNRLIILSYLSQQTGGSQINDDHTINFTVEQMAAALENIKKLYDSGTMEPFGEASVFVGQMEQNNKWINNKIGLLIDNMTATTKYEQSVSGGLDCMPLPKIENAVCSGVNYGGGLGFVINDNSEHKEEAAEFLEWLFNDPEAVKLVQTTYGPPSTTTATTVMTDEKLLSDVAVKAIDIMNQDTNYTINLISGNTEMETLRKDIIQEMIYDEVTPEEGAQEIYDGYEELLETMKAE